MRLDWIEFNENRICKGWQCSDPPTPPPFPIVHAVLCLSIQYPSLLNKEILGQVPKFYKPLKMSTRDFYGGKRSRCVWPMTYHLCSAESQEDLGP